ncbi:MAG: hypothetical protein R6U84_09735 [Candidatus Cloacimonadales bacterium]
MQRGMQKMYNRKRPAHADSAHSKSKNWFKKKSRKSLRQALKQELSQER